MICETIPVELGRTAWAGTTEGVQEMAIERIEVQGREWFDRVNGNSYCSARVLVDDELVVVIPFQYGYGHAFEQYAGEELARISVVFFEKYPNGATETLRRYCARNNIHYSNHICSALKREVQEWGTV